MKAPKSTDLPDLTPAREAALRRLYKAAYEAGLRKQQRERQEAEAREQAA